jgi:predicted dehydrogenase
VSGLVTTTDPVKFGDVEESVTWQMKFPGGTLAHCDATYRFNGINRHRSFAERGWFGLEPAYGYQGVQGLRSDGQKIHMPEIDQFAAEMDDFSQCILNQRPTRVPGEEGLRDVKIMMAIYESARTGRAVNLA